MTGLERFGKLLIEISELSRDERAIVFTQLARDFGFSVPSVERVKSKADPVQKAANRDGYTQEQKDLFFLLARGWNDKPQDFKSGTVAELARRYGRTEKAIRYQITSRIK